MLAHARLAPDAVSPSWSRCRRRATRRSTRRRTSPAARPPSTPTPSRRSPELRQRIAEVHELRARASPEKDFAGAEERKVAPPWMGGRWLPRQRLPRRDRDAELLLPRVDGLRDPAPQRRRRSARWTTSAGCRRARPERRPRRSAGSGRAAAWCRAEVEHHLVDVAPAPAFRRVVALDDRVAASRGSASSRGGSASCRSSRRGRRCGRGAGAPTASRSPGTPRSRARSARRRRMSATWGIRRPSQPPRPSAPASVGEHACSVATTCAPSPTAAATRLVEPARTSPIAKTPARLVSSGRRPRTELGAGAHEALGVERDVGRRRATRCSARRR